MELHFKYYDKVRGIDEELRDTDIDEDEMYLKRLEGGLFTLQLIDYILIDVCASGAASVKQRVLQTLNLRGGSVKTIREIMRGNRMIDFVSSVLFNVLWDFIEYAGNLGDGGESESKEEEKQYVLQLLDKF